MVKSGRSKSVHRTPFADISNGGKPPRDDAKEKIPADRHGGGCLDRLLLARSELSGLFNQIDEIVAQALEQNMRSKSAIEEIESLTNHLSDMHSSLKPWVLRLSQSQARSKLEVQFCHSLKKSSIGNGNSSPSIKDEPKLDMVISPSPLVAWHAGGCRLVKERQLFLLTPMSKQKEKPSQYRSSSKIKARNLDMKDLRDTSQQLCPSATASMYQFKVPKTVMKDYTVKENNMGETRLKLSAQLTTFNSSQQNHGLRSQAYQKNDCNFSDRHSCEGVSDAFSLKNNLLIGPSSQHNFLNRRRNADEALEWFLSPPKTCTIMDPDHSLNPSTLKDKSLSHSKLKFSVSEDPIHGLSQQDDKNMSKHLQETNKSCDGFAIDSEEQLYDLHLCNFTKKKDLDDSLEWFLSPPKTCTLMEPFDARIPTTPAFVDNSVLISRHLGETTLKKELWSKFRVASAGRLSYRDSMLQKETRKGFMDMLEDVS